AGSPRRNPEAAAMALWRIRATVDDRPGFLAVLAASLALRKVNILSVQVHATAAGAVDDFLVDAPDALSEADLLAAVGKGRGRDPWVRPAHADGLVDPPTLLLNLATGPGRVGFQLGAQLGEVHPQVVGLRLVPRPPHLLQQLPVRYQPAGVADQHLQHVPLGRGEPDVAAVAGQAPGGQVDGERVGVHHRLLRYRYPAAQRRPYPRQQLVHPERLGHVVVRPGVERAYLRLLQVPCGQDDHRYRRPAPDALHHLDAVHVGQAEIDDDEIGRMPGGQRLRGTAVGGELHLVPPGGQVDPQRPQ